MNPFYVYALKDPRSTPARPFYVGKGTGNRAWEHTLRVDQTRKGKLIAEIIATGLDVITTVLADDLTEIQALKLESELVAAFGTFATGGFLTNAVVPSGRLGRVRSDLVLPSGAVERAQVGLNLLKEAVLELAQANANGISNADASKALGLQSDYGGGSKDYLAFSVLGILMREGKIARVAGQRKHKALVR
jgi:uncharacterized protein